MKFSCFWISIKVSLSTFAKRIAINTFDIP